MLVIHLLFSISLSPLSARFVVSNRIGPPKNVLESTASNLWTLAGMDCLLGQLEGCWWIDYVFVLQIFLWMQWIM
jgi:hypothetical protein